MAKKSQIARNEKRIATVKKHKARRLEFKAVINNPESSIQERQSAVFQLQALPRDASPVRIRNRCQVTGRARAYMRKFAMSRISFRELSLEGKVPGVTKSSW